MLVTCLVGAGCAVASSAAAGVTSVGHFGDASAFGSPGPLQAPITGRAATPDGRGYWLVAGDGGVFNYGDAGFFGSVQPDKPRPGQSMSCPRAAKSEADGWIVGIATDVNGVRYWLADSSGGVYVFEKDQRCSYTLPTQGAPDPVVAIVRWADGLGYWLVGANGAVLSSDRTREPDLTPIVATDVWTEWDPPIVGMARTPDGHGGWLVDAGGRVYPVSDHNPNVPPDHRPVVYPKPGVSPLRVSISPGEARAGLVGIAADADGLGYWLVNANGVVTAYGDAQDWGSAANGYGDQPIVTIASTPDGYGYWLASSMTALSAGSQPALVADCVHPVAPPISPQAGGYPIRFLLNCDARGAHYGVENVTWTPPWGGPWTYRAGTNYCDGACPDATTSKGLPVPRSFPVVIQIREPSAVAATATLHRGSLDLSRPTGQR